MWREEHSARIVQQMALSEVISLTARLECEMLVLPPRRGPRVLLLSVCVWLVVRAVLRRSCTVPLSARSLTTQVTTETTRALSMPFS